MADWIKVVLDVFPTVGIVVAVVFLVKTLGKNTRRVGHFFDDWFGEPERPGVTKRPGVMERIQDVESELKPNSGKSLRDVVNRVETKQNEQCEYLKQLDSRVTRIEGYELGK